MADPVDLNRLLPDAREFLTELSQNNDRTWFRENKARYDSNLKRPSEKLLAQMADWLAQPSGSPPKTKLFRPHRDVRFSEDKTPYHTHLHMMWSLADGRAWMLGLSTTYATVGAGVMRFDSDQLDRWREAVASDTGVSLDEMVTRHGWRVDPPELKRVPAPFDADHPQEDLLRHKGFVAWRDGMDAELTQNPVDALIGTFTEFAPLIDLMGEVA